MSATRRFLTISSLLLLLECVFVITANACSAIGCIGDGMEVRPSFSVLVNHSNKPLPGVTIEIQEIHGNGLQVSFTTGIEGTVSIPSLHAGTYWIRAHFLGIGAAYECFHVSVGPTKKARRKLTYEWGNEAPATQRIAGTLIDTQPGKGGTPLENLIHPVSVPIIGASLKLQDPINGTVYTATSDKNGYFALDGVPDGVYVIHIEGGTAGDRAYEATDQLIELSPKAKWTALLFSRRDGGGGSCGGTYLELKDPPSDNI